MPKKRILFIGTGGFVCAKKIREMLKPQTLSTPNLKNFIPELDEFDIETETIFRVDASDIMPEHWVKISQRIQEVYKDYDGIIIHQGIDTMHYSASALSFLILSPEIPIIFTGALIPPYLPKSDAARNILDAFRVAADGRVKEVSIVFDGLIMRGNRCVKASDMEYTAFFSTTPPIGKIQNGKVEVDDKLLMPNTGKMSFYSKMEEKVSVIKLIPGIPPDIITLYYELGYKGLIIESFSAGNVPVGARPIVDVMEAAIRNGMFIVLGSQSLHGNVDYDDPNTQMGSFSRYKALQVGAIPSQDMTTETCLTKLMWLIGNFDNDLESINSLFRVNLSGELTPDKENRK